MNVSVVKHPIKIHQSTRSFKGFGFRDGGLEITIDIAPAMIMTTKNHSRRFVVRFTAYVPGIVSKPKGPTIDSGNKYSATDVNTADKTVSTFPPNSNRRLCSVT